MRIYESGDKSYRQDILDAASDTWKCNKTDAVINSCEFSTRMIDNLEEALEHPDMTSDLAEILSTRNVELSREVETSIEID